MKLLWIQQTKNFSNSKLKAITESFSYGRKSLYYIFYGNDIVIGEIYEVPNFRVYQYDFTINYAAYLRVSYLPSNGLSFKNYDRLIATLKEEFLEHDIHLLDSKEEAEKLAVLQ